MINTKSGKWLLMLFLFIHLPFLAFADDSKFDYVMRVNRSTMALVDSNVVVSLQITAIQDVPAAQSVVLAPVLVDTLTHQQVAFPLIFINSRNQQIDLPSY